MTRIYTVSQMFIVKESYEKVISYWGRGTRMTLNKLRKVTGTTHEYNEIVIDCDMIVAVEKGVEQ